MKYNKSLLLLDWGFRITGLVATLIGSYWLFKWLDGDAGKLYSTHVITVKANMALCQMLSGLTILLIGWEKTTRFTRIVATGLASAVFLIGLLTVIEHLLDFDLGIDQLIATELPGAAGTTSPNRMGWIGSLSLTMIGSGLLFIISNNCRIAAYMGAVTCLIVLVPSVGYILDISLFFSKPSITGIAWPSVIALSALGLGLIISRRTAGTVGMFISDESSGILLRRLLPAILLVPLMLGFLVLNGAREGFFDMQVGMGAFIIAMILLFLVLAITTARAIQTANFESKKARKEQEISDRKYSELLKNAPAGIYEIDFRTKRFISVNDAMCLITGYSREELLAMSPFEILDDEGIKVFQTRINKWLSGEKPDENIEYRIKTKDNRVIYAVLKVNFKSDELGSPTGALVVAHDITDRRNLENELKRLSQQTELENQRLQTILETSPPAVVVIEAPDGKYSFMNKRAQELYGTDFKGIDLKTNVDKVVAKKPDGRLYGMEEVPAGRALYKGEVVRNEEMIIYRSDGHKIPVLASAAPVRNRDGQIISAVVVFEDITERKMAEEAVRISEERRAEVQKKAEENLRLAYEEMEEGVRLRTIELQALNEEFLRSNRDLESFAYIASHDLQEPLRMVSSFTQLLQKQYNDKLDDKANEYINYAVAGSKRMYELLNGLLAYSRINTRREAFNMVDLNRTLENVLGNLQLKIEERNAIVKSEELPTVYADSTQMNILFQNLIINGIKFSPKPPRINISSRLKDGIYTFSVKDEGIGIESRYFDKIFEIFQRLQPREYQGTGIGLAICKRIVERHGGRIWLESEVGKGTTFLFNIPKRHSSDKKKSLNQEG